MIAAMTTDDSASELFSTAEAAAKLTMSKRDLVRLARIRDIASLEREGEYYFTPRAIQEWIERNERKAWA
jgi:helix-turn-helix protein